MNERIRELAEQAGIEYDINDKSIKRDISFGQWFAKITCSIIIISAIAAAIVYYIWK